MRQRPNASDARSWHVVLGALTFLAELVTTGRAWPPAPSPGRLVVEGARQAARSFLQVNLSGVRRRDGGSSLSARGPQLRAGFTPGGHHRASAGASEPTCDSASTSRLAVAWEHKNDASGRPVWRKRSVFEASARSRFRPLENLWPFGKFGPFSSLNPRRAR